MIIDVFSGDPKIILTANGATIQVTSGQVLMDQGIENQANLALFSDDGWIGNLLLPAVNKIGSPFERLADGLSVTAANMARTTDLATKALAFFPEVVVAITNPQSWYLKMSVLVGPGQQPLSVQKYGPNWQAQATNPAGAKVTVTT